MDEPLDWLISSANDYTQAPAALYPGWVAGAASTSDITRIASAPGFVPEPLLLLLTKKWLGKCPCIFSAGGGQLAGQSTVVICDLSFLLQ